MECAIVRKLSCQWNTSHTTTKSCHHSNENTPEKAKITPNDGTHVRRQKQAFANLLPKYLERVGAVGIKMESYYGRYVIGKH